MTVNPAIEAITAQGVGIVRSIRAQELAKKNRKLLKKLSDFIEEHKKLFNRRV